MARLTREAFQPHATVAWVITCIVLSYRCLKMCTACKVNPGPVQPDLQHSRVKSGIAKILKLSFPRAPPLRSTIFVNSSSFHPGSCAPRPPTLYLSFTTYYQPSHIHLHPAANMADDAQVSNIHRVPGIEIPFGGVIPRPPRCLARITTYEDPDQR